MATKGEERMRLNVPQRDRSETVNTLNMRAADFIDCVEGLLSVRFSQDTPRYQERERMVRLAQTKMEEAAMWAVKAATN